MLEIFGEFDRHKDVAIGPELTFLHSEGDDH